MDSALVSAEFYLSLMHICHKEIFTSTPTVFSSLLTHLLIKCRWFSSITTIEIQK